MLLANWGTTPASIVCGDTAMLSSEIEIIAFASAELCIQDLDELMQTMSYMSDSQRAFLAGFLKMRSSIIASEE